MYEALSVVTWYFALDVVEDISGDTLKFSLDKTVLPGGGGTAGTHVTPGADPELDAWIATLRPFVLAGKTRYWWSLLLGAGQPVSPQQGTSRIFGRLVDSPNMPIFDWKVTIPN